MAKVGTENRLLDILVRRGAASPDDVEDARQKAATAGERLEKWLVEKGVVEPEEMAAALAEYLDMPPINLRHFSVDEGLLNILPKETMSMHMVIPVMRMKDRLMVALGDPFDVVAVDELHAITGLEIVPMVAPETQVTEYLQRFVQESTEGLEEILKDVEEADEVELGQEQQEDMSLDEMLQKAEDAPVIRIVNSILVEGIRKRASDIHIEPLEKSLRLRYRVDGVLYESPSPPKQLQGAITSRIKIMGNLDIAERRV
ncbi:MAG: type II secretion system protein GspE, partial [Verrucomicrobia bacterium]